MKLDPNDVTLTTAVERVMSRQLVSITRDAPVSAACAAMIERSVGCAVIVDAAGRLEGVFTERDLVTRVVGQRRDPARTPVGEVMTTSPIVIQSQTSVAEASEILSERGFRHAPVLSAEGALVGVISTRDLFRVPRRLGRTWRTRGSTGGDRRDVVVFISCQPALESTRRCSLRFVRPYANS